MSQVNPDTKFFVAEDGRTLLFHGVNVVYKVPPYIPITTEFHPTESLSAKDMDDMQRWGWNSVRLGIMWPGVEPTEGMYNKTYMAMMVDIVNQLGARGIYSILDFHQGTAIRTSWSPRRKLMRVPACVCVCLGEAR